MYQRNKGALSKLAHLGGPIQTLQNKGHLSKTCKPRTEHDLHGLCICRCFESVLPDTQGNESDLFPDPAQPDPGTWNERLTDAHSAGLLAEHRAALASSAFSSCRRGRPREALWAHPCILTYWLAGLRPPRSGGREKEVSGFLFRGFLMTRLASESTGGTVATLSHCETNRKHPQGSLPKLA